MKQEQTYLVMVEHQDPEDDKSGPAVVETGPGCHSLEFCQSLAQRMQESGHGKATIGRFVPVSMDEQKEIRIRKNTVSEFEHRAKITKLALFTKIKS